MITKAEVNEAIDKLGVPHYYKLCFRHPDIRVRAGFQAIVTQRAAGFTGGQMHPPVELLRATPAGQKIPADESPLMVSCCCEPGGCKPAPRVEPPVSIEYLTEDAE
jgi:hypothetical protein